MDPKDYSYRYYKSVSMNRKRQVIDSTIEELHNIQMDMIEELVALSEYNEAKAVITYIKENL